MLIRFIVENFLSFNSEAELSLIANKERRKPEHLIRNNDLNLLKTAVIYGANSAGKSNLVKAMSFAREVLLAGINKASPLNCHYRFNKDNIKQPSRFGFEIKVGTQFYSYGFALLLEKNQVEEEWLYEIGKTTEKKIFERYRDEEGYHHIEIGIKFPKEVEKRFSTYKADMTRSNDLLFLTELNRKSLEGIAEIRPFKDVFTWFRDQLTILKPTSKYRWLDFIGDEPEMSKAYNAFLNVFNVGIDNIISANADLESLDPSGVIMPKISKELKEGKVVLIEAEGKKFSVRMDESGNIHAKKIGLEHHTSEGGKVVFDIENESDGTQRLLDLIPALHQMARLEKVYVVDELDRSLHSKLTCEILNVFLEITKGKESQLIVTTHESLLLDLNLLRRDEIWFVEIENRASKLYSLDEFKVRNDKAIRKDYLLGRYGALPIFNSFDHLNL